MKKLVLFFGLLALCQVLFGQKLAHTGVSVTNAFLRTNPVVVGQVIIEAPAAGKVILRFDGYCLSAEGDRIILAASNTPNWSGNDGCVELEAASADINSNAFSHTRAYDVEAGTHTFYAVAQNHFETDGSGIASVYGSLSAEWFPQVSGKAFAWHKGFFYEEIPVEGGPTAFSTLNIDAPAAGKVLVRFDGKCISSYGDLMFFAASNTPTWTNYDGSTSCEVIDNDLNRFSFSHTRVYDIAAGNHTFYAVVENFFETYGNGFASVYGSLTVQYYPATESGNFAYQPINTPFGVNIEGPPVNLGSVQINAAVAGQVLVNFVGTGIGSNGDQMRLAASDTPDWSPNDGCIIYEPYSSDLNRVSFSHTRAYPVQPGNHTYYAVIQNVDEFEGTGLAVVYAALTAKFFPDASSATEEPAALRSIRISPNPADDYLQIEYPDAADSQLQIMLFDQQGRLIKVEETAPNQGVMQQRWTIADLPAGLYLIQCSNSQGSTTRKFVKH